jgi:hypothetical protein
MTADATCVQLACGRRDDRDPWPASAVVAALLRFGAERTDRPHATGAGRGIPILFTQRLRLGECDIEVHAVHAGHAADEVTLTLPSWDELCGQLDGESAFWDLCDTAAAACDAQFGCIGDGAALPQMDEGRLPGWQELLRTHPGALLADDHQPDLRSSAAVYRMLPDSGLCVVLR